MRTGRIQLRAAPGVAALLLGLGCAAFGQVFREPEDAVVVTVRPDPLYEMLVPYYVELCAVSQYRPRTRPLGGIPGHAVMYLKGACRDETAPYPRLRPCAGNVTDSSSPEHGAGVSVNRWFENVNWVATPGKRLFFDGNLGTYDRLDQAHFDATVEEALDQGLFRGVQVHAKPGAEAPQPLPVFVAEDSVGTDFALRFGRSVFCARLPMTETMLRQSMDYLNGLNDEYATGDAHYEWSGYADNCVHTLHNALAAARVWEAKSVRAIKLRQIFNIAVPANTFVDLAFLANEYPIEDFDAIYRDELHWQNLLENGWLPAVPGALVKTLAVHQENELYDTKFRLFVLEGFFSSRTTQRAHDLLSDGRFTSIDANLRYFQDRYARILEERDDPGWLERARGDDYLEGRRLYYEHIAERQRAVEEALYRLAELDRIREELLERAREEWEARTGALRVD